MVSVRGRVGYLPRVTKKPPRDCRGGFVVCGGQLHKHNGRHLWRPLCTFMDAQFIVEEVIRSWQAWQRPTLPSLET
jgi:hypothetical protein